jgi:hypothetical protein
MLSRIGKPMGPSGRLMTPIQKVLAKCGLAGIGSEATYMLYPNDPSRVSGNRHYLNVGGVWTAAYSTLTGTMANTGVVTGGTFTYTPPACVESFKIEWAGAVAFDIGFSRNLTASERTALSQPAFWTALFAGTAIVVGSCTGGSSVIYSRLLDGTWNGPFASSGTLSAIYYNVSTNHHITLRKPLGSSRIWAMNFLKLNGLDEDTAAMKVVGHYVQRVSLAIGQATTPAYTTSGTWGTSTTVASYSGKASYSKTANSYIQHEFTGVTRLGSATFGGGTNYGLVLVSIDGDKTLADLLPTAQDLVTAGTYADTILVANGGTLNPTDRVWDTYNLSNNIRRPGAPSVNPPLGAMQWFTESLASGTHTLRLTITGYKRAASTDAYAYICMVVGGSDSYATSATSLNFYETVQNIATTIRPIWDLSYNTLPDGEASYEWMGHDDSETVDDTPVLNVDGVGAALVSGTELFGSVVEIVLVNKLIHSGVAGPIGSISYSHSLSNAGYAISHTLTWGVAGLTNGYPFMMSLDSAQFDRFNTSDNTAIELPGTTGGNYVNSAGKTAWAWDNDGYVVATLHIPDLASVDNWANITTSKLWWYDFIGTWRKAYATRYETVPPHAFLPSDSITSACLFNVSWHPLGVVNS